MVRRRKVNNYSLFNGHAFYTPDVKGMLIMLLWLLFGACIGSVVTMIITMFFGSDAAGEYGTLIAYPLMFVPAMMYAGLKSRRNMLFDTGYALDSNHFGKLGGALCAVMAVVATIAAGFMTDLLNAQMPPMPEWLQQALETMTEGNIWINLLCVSIMAPICEEWLCRGEILRGLLNSKKADGSRVVSPGWAIVISALFFAIIHANPWQAIPAFILGCLFGYVYYRTGSLKLTMLMHCANNTLMVVLSNIDAFSGMEYWTDVLPAREYGIIFAACGLMILLIIRAFRRIPTLSPDGSCDPIQN